MPNGHGAKEYGGHKYADHDGTSDCQYGCGCWMGPARSGGPVGLNPGGVCPKNPKDGMCLGGNTDYELVVTERIKSLESRLYQAESRLKRMNPSKAKLADKLASVKTELAKKKRLLAEVRRLIRTGA